jgi:hypothetical protein
VTDFQPLQELERVLGQAGAMPPTLFPPNSRYHNLPTATLAGPDGAEVVFLIRRLVPPPEDYDAAGRYPVGEGDRLDNVAFRLLGDPELFWRLCDANRAVVPTDLEEPGRALVVPLPSGVRAPTAGGAPGG